MELKCPNIKGLYATLYTFDFFFFFFFFFFFSYTLYQGWVA